jgi:hypothetical protein
MMKYRVRWLDHRHRSKSTRPPLPQDLFLQDRDGTMTERLHHVQRRLLNREV